MGQIGHSKQVVCVVQWFVDMYGQTGREGAVTSNQSQAYRQRDLCLKTKPTLGKQRKTKRCF